MQTHHECPLGCTLRVTAPVGSARNQLGRLVLCITDAHRGGLSDRLQLCLARAGQLLDGGVQGLLELGILGLAHLLAIYVHLRVWKRWDEKNT